jgi:hypothetical protein
MRTAKLALPGCLLALAVIVSDAAITTAALRPPPLEFVLSPEIVEPGRPITIRIAAHASSEWLGSGPLDVYVMWATTDRAAFLTPNGAWSPTPVALRQGIQSGSAVTAIEWQPRPPGELPLAMVAVPSGADPLRRSSWRFQPVLRSARVATPASGGPADRRTAAALLAAAMVATAVVALVPRTRA